MTKTASDGSASCECDAGFEIVGGKRCEPCGLGAYKAASGNSKCTECSPSLAWRSGPSDVITAAVASDSVDLCVCKKGYYSNITSADDAGRGALSCSQCVDTHETRSLDMTNCSRPGSTLYRLPISRGYWRERPETQYVRACDFPEACVGGTDTAAQCAEGHHGPLCDLCDEGYHGGRGAACELYEGSLAITIGLPIGMVVAALIVAIYLASRFRKMGLRKVVSKLTSIVDAAGGAAIDHEEVDLASAVSAVQEEVASLVSEAAASRLEQRMQGATVEVSAPVAPSPPASPPAPREERTSTHPTGWQLFGSALLIIEQLGVKMKIIISLYQVLTQLGVTFDIDYPDFYEDLLSIIGSLNLDIGLLPFACVARINYYLTLLTSTLVPIFLVAVFGLLSKVLRRRNTNADGTSTRGPDGEEPLGLSLANTFSDLWFFTLFLLYPSVCATIFKFFVAETFDQLGESRVSLLRVDRSIDMASPAYSLFFAYDIVMLLLFPIGASRATTCCAQSIHSLLALCEHADFSVFLVPSPLPLPAGVPLLYGLLLFSSRDELRELQRIELIQEAEFNLAMMQAEELDEELVEEKRRVIAQAKKAHEVATLKLKEVREKLPSTLKKLTAGYNMRTYW